MEKRCHEWKQKRNGIYFDDINVSPFDFIHICSGELQPGTLEIMQSLKKILFTWALLWLSASAQDTQSENVDPTTEYFDIPSYETTTTSPEDNGMTIPEEVKFEQPTVKEEETSALEEQPIVTFPDNHKNFTPSQYLGEDYPPYQNYLSPYQQQYKNYYEQKQIFSNRKPIKFEEDSFKNFYYPNSLDVGDEKKVETFRVNRNPFPYVFETQKVNEYKANDHVTHQDIVPYYVYHHDRPLEQEEKYYKGSHYHVTKEGSPWKKVFHVLTALVPLGLILATLTPNVISINSTSTTKTTRQRSEDSSPFTFKEEDVIKQMKKYGIESVNEGQCEDRIICELALQGGKNMSGPVEKGFWFLANQTPREIAEQAGMSELFKAIRTGNCDIFKCHKTTLKSKLGKKIIRKHKTTAPQ